MNRAQLPTYEVKFPLSGMTCRVLVRTASPARALIVTRDHLTHSGVKDVETCIECATVCTLPVVEDVEGIVAAQNRHAANASLDEHDLSITWNESSIKWVVKNGDWELAWCDSRQEAENFIQRILSKGSLHEETVAA
jgi:hypothetical protein